MQNDRTGLVLAVLVLGTGVVFGAWVDGGRRLGDAVSAVAVAPVQVPSDFGATLGLLLLFVGTVALVRRVVAP
ncbi:hypothetical protein [Halogeometricum limi]|uniref:Uncharacterized protein n=1 Tax=Halogeometricum limi TaxID=555875 RepID=A0A1I6IRN7_9EURY|nr:hypothetical protein [Halogeometricum limi]SFR69309.1 hypothetical protein SAMN04488124_3569 [Halogeometricum limi]